MPITMPAMMAVSTDNDRSAPATVFDSPCASVRYGTPHISTNTVIENWEPMWVKKPNRVPGVSHTVFTLTSVSRMLVLSSLFTAPSGVSWTTSSVSTIASRPIAAAERYAVVHPGPTKTARNGTADSTWPNCPQMPVNWVTSGTWPGGNQCGTNRSTEMNVTASPRPTIARPATAAGNDSVNARTSWPVDITAAPATINFLEPSLSSSTPAGTCAPA